MSIMHACNAKDECKEHLQLDKTKGGAPLTVKIIGPHVLLERCQGWKKFGPNRGGPGCVVRWGDNSFNTWADATHLFKTPGTYSVEASLYYCAPNDAQITYWHEQTTVTVTAPSEHN